jgi:hypothetical protein
MEEHGRWGTKGGQFGYFAVVPPDREQGYATVAFKTHHAIIDPEFERTV